MNKLKLLGPLLEELENEDVQSDVALHSKSKAIIYMADDDEEETITLNADECRLIFSNVDVVDRLFEALENPKNAGIEIYDLDLSHEILDALERRFTSVDEV